MFLKIVAWAATIIVVVFGTLVVVGLMASPQAGPSLRGFGPEDAEEKVRKYHVTHSFFWTIH